MIDLTVRTLDSQNHPFSVEDDITVAQFKTKIADTVNIPAETQRIIYCGRVLEDDVKLSDYDVNGKVVHLVERAPPSLQGNSETGAPAPQPQRRRFRGFEQGNAMYLGTMAIPLESQGIVPPPPTHSLAASRLNVARRMLKRAEAVIRSLEDPHFRPTEQSTTVEEPQEEVTPVFEARVIVPHTDEPIDEDLVLSAVENSLVNVGAVPVNSETVFVPTEASVEANSAEQPQSEAVASPSTLPVENSPQSTTTAESSSSDRRNPSDGSNSNLSENASRTSEMSELLTMLGELQVRFAPFLERYQNFMREDPVVADEELRQTQTMINRVSEVLHFLGHAYHSLSDIILKVRTPPPRALLCRPILIQHSAVVQTGFPIQLEAQINFTRPTTTSEGQASTTTSSTTVTSTSNTSTSTTPTQPPVTANIQPPLVGVPLIPGASMRFQSIPVEIRGISRNIRSTNNNNVPSTRGSQQTAGDATAGVEDGVLSDTASTATNQQAGDAAHNNSRANNQTPGFNIPGLDNRNVEFFMEVTPGNIMSGFGGSNPASDVLRGSLPLNPLPPELIQSIMEMAGQMINLDPQQLNINVSRSSEPSAPPSESGSTAQSGVNRGVSGQNSQARGNTETNPTTATHTRSTSRPHVHLAQHAMQGFDPFLPCNSHHVSSRRRIHIRNVNQQVGQGASNRNRTQRETAQQTNTSGNLGPELLLNVFQNYFRNVSNQASGGSSEQSGATRPDSATPASWPSFASFLPHLQNMNLSDGGRQGPTIAQILQQFPSEEAYQERQSVFSDLVMFLSRNLTIGDVIQLTSRRLEPLLRIRNELRNFVLQRILDGSTSAAAVDRGVNRLINEIQPFLENLGLLQVRNDIDVIRSAEMLFRARLPNIINLSTSRSPNALRLLVNQCTITARQLCALVVTASATGETGVQEVFERIVTNYMVGIPADIQQWTLITSRVQFQRFISNLSVPESVLQPYIVRRAEAVLPSIVNSVSSNDSTGSSDEPMECDVSSAAGGSTEFNTSINLTDENEPLPAVVIGSEGWHSQVPADWVPIITRDTQRQRRQNSQPPFSDAYLSGMPSKRRKIVTSSKPQGSLPQVISESVRRAVTASGLASVAPLETVAQATGGDVNVQAAYRDLLRSSVQTVIQDNEDFTPDRFPNASNYFNRQ